ncbi:MAG: hypothetical protein H0U59_09995 [Gemmatimonadaceae bacterium]|nr:hypothetical protein [Gemmatimonadaceae bacterium]
MSYGVECRLHSNIRHGLARRYGGNGAESVAITRADREALKPTRSWWIQPSDEAFAKEAKVEAERMTKGGRSYEPPMTREW